MAVQVVVPPIGESVTEAVIARWYVQQGDLVARDQPVCEIESDKVNLDVPAPESGRLALILKKADETVSVGETIAEIEPVEGIEASSAKAGSGPEAPATESTGETNVTGEPPVLSPAVRRLVTEHAIAPEHVAATGPGGRLTKGDVLTYLEAHPGSASAARSSSQPGEQAPLPQTAPAQSPLPQTVPAKSPLPQTVPAKSLEPQSTQVQPPPAQPQQGRPASPPLAPQPQPGASWLPPEKPVQPRAAGREERVRMSPLRRKVAERLVQVQHTAAILTTFNEVDMTRVLELRKAYQAAFTAKYGIKLGIMSFFVKASIEALRAYPGVNAEVDAESIVYKRYYDIGVAVGGGKGLVVPVVRDADRLSFAEVEMAIAELAKKARENRLTLEDLSGGTFTISNGGIYGSLMSTPILNPPQTGILGMHKTMDRAVVVDGEVVVRPMMYLALSYDHRVIDGREAVSFLIRVKECIENPERILLEV